MTDKVTLCWMWGVEVADNAVQDLLFELGDVDNDSTDCVDTGNVIDWLNSYTLMADIGYRNIWREDYGDSSVVGIVLSEETDEGIASEVPAQPSEAQTRNLADAVYSDTDLGQLLRDANEEPLLYAVVA